ncbi:hypothetical protein EJB05_03584, partial [Eragrostis curvula]
MMLRVPPSPAAAAAAANQLAGAASATPVSELKGELSLVPKIPNQSLARHKFVDKCEAAISEQMKSVLCSLAFIYQLFLPVQSVYSLWVWNTMPHMHFKESSDEEREHAEKLMKYQIHKRLVENNGVKQGSRSRFYLRMQKLFDDWTQKLIWFPTSPKELKGELSLVPKIPNQSLARHKFVDKCEAAISEQMKSVLCSLAFIYQLFLPVQSVYSLWVWNTMPHMHFKESSDEEREHAEKLMKYQNKRGGRVRLQSMVTPLTEFDHSEKGNSSYGQQEPLLPQDAEAV